jgi:peptidoglycan/xylan/chitin deacetylase (PgdA/CDA1 family)
MVYAYHGLTPAPLPVPDWCFLEVESFRQQVAYLHRQVALLSLSEGVRRLTHGDLDGPAAVLTFDDGFRSVHDLALPVLETFGVPATVFLVTGLLDTDDTVWFCRLHHALSTSDQRRLVWDGESFGLGSPQERARSSATLQDRLKRLPPSRLGEAVAGIVRTLGGRPDQPVAEDSPYRILDRERVAAMARSGLVEFGAHTVSHAILRRLASPERRCEVRDSLAAVQRATGRPCELFAYPNGGAADYDPDAVRLLRECGVQAAVTTIHGSNDADTPVLELRRIGVGPETTIADLAGSLA